MMSDVLDEVLSIFDCDRAFLDYPCDPDAASWSAPMERTKPEYPGAHAESLEAPMDPDVARVFRNLLESDGPVKFGPESEHPLPREMSRRFGYKSQLLMALYPKTGAPWVFGIHQCSYPRVWTKQEETLLQEIGEGRLTEGLTSFLMYRKLRDSEEKYRTMMEALVEPLAIFAHDYTIEYMNPSMIRRIGRDATGEKCYSSLHGLDAMCDWCDLDKVLQGKKPETTITSPLDDRKYRISSMPIKKKDGTVSKMTIYRDITDYLKAVSEKEKAQAQLVQAQKLESIGNLAGGIAHDFNNILTSIIGYAELALDNAKNGWTVADELQEVLTASQRATDLVAQILAFARQSDENVKPVKVYNIINEVLSFIRSTIPTSIEIRKGLESKAFIMGNPTQVHQIIMNLCTNAAQAMEDEGGILEVRLKDLAIDKDFDNKKVALPFGNYIEISVSDSGTGIGPEIMDSIFEPYFTTKELGEGTGMGLAVVHGIVQSYGGDIIVESKFGEGTTFTTYLPVTSQQKGEHRYELEPVPYGAERVLFVDDEAQIARMGSQILERLGYKVTTRTSSIEALELFRAKPNDFDLIITDMTMPNLNGDKMTREMMKIRQDIPVILCTGYSKLITDESAAEMGIKALVYKPIVKSDLAKIIRKVMGEVKEDTQV
jgi:nitrogen-specific signal transduction histidine kinase/ActR/RegA family two-component response regulator